MKLQYDYYTQTEGFPEVKINLQQAIEIVQRFRDIESKNIREALHDPNNGEIICSDSVKVWAEEAMHYKNR